MDLLKLKARLIKVEGLKLQVYTDTMGIPTIGVGRNLNKGISSSEAMTLLDNDITDTVIQVRTHYPWFDTLDEPRQRALIDMAFNVGIGGLDKFKNMLAGLSTHNWQQAHDEALNSTWSHQVGQRAIDIATTFLTGIN